MNYYYDCIDVINHVRYKHWLQPPFPLLLINFDVLTHSCSSLMLCLLQFASLAPLYYRGAAVIIIVYDITDKSSYERMKYWVDEIKQYGPPDALLVVAGNKLDIKEQREVSFLHTCMHAHAHTHTHTCTHIRHIFRLFLLFPKTPFVLNCGHPHCVYSIA